MTELKKYFAYLETGIPITASDETEAFYIARQLFIEMLQSTESVEINLEESEC